MCGIAGWMLRDPGAARPAHDTPLLRALHHRGPDDHGVYRDDDRGLALVHTRLSILDLSARGHQPMVDAASGDVLAFNGEIYNHRPLREQLERLGHAFRSHCDTEVLLRALAQWGMDALERVHGMYAFAWWHRRDATLHLARDPMGVKPLYWSADLPEGGVMFSSELRALAGLPGFRPRIDRRSLRQYMEFGYTFDPQRTILDGVRKLPPGHRLAIRAGRAGEPVRHFDPALATEPPSAAPRLEAELHDALSQVVAEQLHADVPVALLLSGGLDSSVVAALAARHTTVHTVSYGFGDSRVDEREHARTVARHLGTDHDELLIAPDDVLGELDSAVAHFDDLFADWGLVSTRLVYRKCRERGIKVVLVGEGADELFGGYRARFAPGLRPVSPWTLDWRLFLLYRRYIARRYGSGFLQYRRRMREHVAATGGDLFAAIRLFESRDQLPGNHVMKVDKASMSVSVEARTPYLDDRVARIAYRVPGAALIDGNGVKNLLRAMARRHGLLPDAVIEREKFGASIAASWMDASPAVREFASRVALGDESWADALGLRGAMRAYFHGARPGYPFPHALSIFQGVAWRLVLLNLWSRQLGLSPSHA